MASLETVHGKLVLDSWFSCGDNVALIDRSVLENTALFALSDPADL